jgi:hypothetical protein
VHPPGRDWRRAAQVLGAAQAPPALATRRAPADDDSVAGTDVLDSGTDGLDDPGSLVAEQHREWMVVAGTHDVEIGVADTGGLDPNARLARAGLVEVDLLDAVAVELGQDDAAIHDLSVTDNGLGAVLGPET